MRFFIFFFLTFQGVKVEEIQISGYIGDSVTLPSKADPSWVLSKVDWSIFTNNTWIATFDNGKINTDRRTEYKGRLTLDGTSGDLTISNLTQRDAMTYTVDLVNKNNVDKVNKIILTVKEHLQQPKITKIHFPATTDGCTFALKCSSPDDGVDFTWDVKPSCPHWSSSQTGASELVVLSSSSVNVNCTVRRKEEKKTTVWESSCNGPKESPKCVRGYGWVAAIVVFVVAVIVLCMKGKRKLFKLFM
ncbi:PREDICTED: CD48 antigen-like [Cyprinodon variegatus]|uniref:CD48 antigen-like n=1 Tax=Cyprinodon variegatus TaxID=28743 RepID=UPI0007429419|nr:PREDICTED: CD48 antigen-like [Cyprinodon variegatus]